jgi:hypothetical protein
MTRTVFAPVELHDRRSRNPLHLQQRARIRSTFLQEVHAMAHHSLLPEEDPVRRVDVHSAAEQQPGAVLATDDHELIREWAAQHDAEPATGEQTPSGPATINVRDDGTGIRFNFPAAARFRPITWDEWFQNFARHDLMFVYERDVPGQTPSARYRLVPREKLRERQPSL